MRIQYSGGGESGRSFKRADYVAVYEYEQERDERKGKFALNFQNPLDCCFYIMRNKHRLYYDKSSGRYDIRFDVESYYGGLHCGECFEVKVKDTWIPVRIEMDMSDQWYLVGFPRTKLDGLRVRI